MRGERPTVPDGEFYAGRRLHLRALAIAHAEQTRRDLEREGWRLPEEDRRVQERRTV